MAGWGFPTAAGIGRRGTSAYFAAFGIAGLLAAAPALAADPGTGGATPTDPAPPAASRPAPALPLSASRITSVRCTARCAGPAAAKPGSRLRLRGLRLRSTDEVAFLGAAGNRDDVSAAPITRSRSAVSVRLPLAAPSGPLAVVNRDGVSSPPSAASLAVEAPAPTGTAPSVAIDVQARRAYFDAARPMRVTYMVHDVQPVDVVVELVGEADGAVITRWTPGLVAPDTLQTVQWNGMAGGQVQRPGRYAFRVLARDASGLRASSSQAAPGSSAPDPSEFVFLQHRFPVRGAHGYGEFAASFGGGRGHQGQDVFATCGTPLVAARGGRVKFKQYHSRAGYYLVVDGQRTGIDYAYMHMREAALVGRGDRVRTGQLIGYVGDTGDAQGCHLHFEMWTAPGWYSGGHPFDPLPSLRDWDRQP